MTTPFRVERLTVALFGKPGVQARLEQLLEQVSLAPERRRPEDTLRPPQWRDPRLSFVAVDASERVAGFVTGHASPTVPHAVFVPWLVVDAAVRGRGIGRALMEAVLAAAAAERFVGVALYVAEDDREAQAFYDRLGGERVRYMPPRADAELKRGGQWIYRWLVQP